MSLIRGKMGLCEHSLTRLVTVYGRFLIPFSLDGFQTKEENQGLSTTVEPLKVTELFVCLSVSRDSPKVWWSVVGRETSAVGWDSVDVLGGSGESL